MPRSGDPESILILLFTLKIKMDSGFRSR